jgi:methanogenic corrinoid protein MtbC1
MSGPVVLDRAQLALAISEVEAIGQTFPKAAVAQFAQEVVRRVANNLVVHLPEEVLPTSKEVDALSEALLEGDDSRAIALIEQAQRKGAHYDVLCQAYLAESARRLGSWWDADKVPFYRVTVAAGRIYSILRILRLQRPVQVQHKGRSAIFAAVPGESHTLGITMATDMARERGWDIELFVGRSHDELVDLLRQRETVLIGLSAGTKRVLPALIKLIVALRISNPGTKIMVCGQIAARNVNLAGITGVDAVATDFEQALSLMERFAGEAKPGH